jgi:hypothetical protein
MRPPLPHSSVRPQMPSAADASSGRRPSSAPPPGVERWERRASASHTPPPVEDVEKEPQKAQRSQRAE